MMKLRKINITFKKNQLKNIVIKKIEIKSIRKKLKENETSIQF
jgi:hypothetical protein